MNPVDNAFEKVLLQFEIYRKKPSMQLKKSLIFSIQEQLDNDKQQFVKILQQMIENDAEDIISIDEKTLFNIDNPVTFSVHQAVDKFEQLLQPLKMNTYIGLLAIVNSRSPKYYKKIVGTALNSLFSLFSDVQNQTGCRTTSISSLLEASGWEMIHTIYKILEYPALINFENDFDILEQERQVLMQQLRENPVSENNKHDSSIIDSSIDPMMSIIANLNNVLERQNLLRKSIAQVINETGYLKKLEDYFRLMDVSFRPSFDKNETPSLFFITPSSPTLSSIKKLLDPAFVDNCLQSTFEQESPLNGINDKISIGINKYNILEYKYSNVKTKETHIITVKDYEKHLTVQDDRTRKILNFLLQKENEGNGGRDIIFNLDEVVDRGLYKSKESAYKGLKNSIDKLMEIRCSGTACRGKKEISSIEYALFTGRKITFSKCSVRIEPELFIFLKQYYTILPVWGDTLSKKAYDLLDYIFFRARQELKNLQRKGSFNMKFDTINAHLGQKNPSELQNNRNKLIRDPILDAIREIELEQNKYIDNHGGECLLKLTCEYNATSGKSTDFLDGFLTVELEPASLNYFLEVKDRLDKKTETNMKKTEALRKYHNK